MEKEKLKTFTLNKREIAVLKEALDNQKIIARIRADGGGQKSKEDAINELYNIESIEKKVK
jgi:hypothetical protein